jgi:hypothetical protein
LVTTTAPDPTAANASTTSAVTICTVAFDGAAMVAANLDLTAAANPGVEVLWNIADNDPERSPALDELARIEHVQVESGAEIPDVPYQVASYHHGAALNGLLRGLRPTRHVVVIDPDFFVIAPDWISRCRRYVEEAKLTFFGAPWHPRWFTKPWDALSPHFLWIDLHRVEAAEIDFSPDGDRGPTEQLDQSPTLVKVLDTCAQRVLPDWRVRRTVGRSNDTACRLTRGPHRRRPRATLDPYYEIARHRPLGPPGRRGRVADIVLPRRLRLVPQPGTFSPTGFADCGLPDLDARGWEEFMWAGKPFGFHVRSYPRRVKDGMTNEELAAEVRAVLAEIDQRRTRR